MTKYLIETRDGPKTLDHEKLTRLVDQGKIPEHIKVKRQSDGEVLTVSQALAVSPQQDESHSYADPNPFAAPSAKINLPIGEYEAPRSRAKIVQIFLWISICLWAWALLIHSSKFPI